MPWLAPPPPQRLYSMDLLRRSHKAKGKEKLCFSLTRPLGSGSPEGVVKAGAAELVDKGPWVPTLPFPLRKPRKAHKYLRLSRKKFPPRGPSLESHSHGRELFLQESAAADALQSAGEWEPTEQPPEEEGESVCRCRAMGTGGVDRACRDCRWGVPGLAGEAGGSEPGWCPACARPPACLTLALACVCLRPAAAADTDAADGPPPWTPTLPPSEVTVTDITANSITVTFREAQVAEGFFRDRREKF